MDRNKLRQLLKGEEDPKLDFKASLSLSTESEKKELTKDVIAMANTRGGRGYIIFGIEDKTKKLLGINPGEFHEEQIQQIIYNRCDPPVPISVEFIELDGRDLAVLTIFKSSQQPHMMLQTGAFYIRRGSTTDVARRSEIANLFQENGLMTYETIILKNAGLEELDQALVGRYFRNLDVTSERPNEILMEAMGIIGRRGDFEGYRITVGGLLLFGRDPSVFMPQVYVKITCKEDTVYLKGNIVKLLENASSHLRQVIGDGDYPYNALEEVLANALVHRDYLDISRGISVAIGDKKIEISNPGSLMAGNSVYKFSRDSNPERRNPWLYQRLVTADQGWRFLKSGAGLSRIRKAFNGRGTVKFLNAGSQNLFKVILPR